MLRVSVRVSTHGYFHRVFVSTRGIKQRREASRLYIPKSFV
ncbi:MAG: hypothetical protein VSS75_019625 [Candidatus Parabeggiatoa sp.]|nr:hypothetical protein [Candidatus Parabeggiatoa sp.]